MFKTGRRWFTVLLAALMGAAVLTGTAAAGATNTTGSSVRFSGTINYDAAISLSGPVGPYGTAGLVGIEQAIKLVNASGGILGKQVVLHYYDDASTPSTALLAAEALESRYPSPFLQAGSSTSETSAILPYANQLPVLTFSLGTSTTVITPAINPYTFGVYASELQFDRAAAMALKTLKVSKVGLLFGNSAATQTGLMYTSRFSAVGIKVAGTETVSESASDFTVALQRLKNDGAMAVYANFATPNPFPVVARDMQSIGWNVPLLAGPAVAAQSAMGAFPSGLRVYALAPSLYLKATSGLSPLATKFVNAVVSAGQAGQLAVAADYGDGVFLSAYAANTAKSTNVHKMLAALNNLGSKNISEQVVGLPNPKYSSSVHTLDNGNFSNYWALLRPGSGPRYSGTAIIVPRGFD